MPKIHTSIILGIVSLAVVAAFLVPPIPQDVDYHIFADQRDAYGIPNAFDVLSNVPFIIVGLLGLKLLAGGVGTGGLPALLWHYRIFFLGVLFTGVGSAYYHWRPDNATLFWDRLPMTISFTAFFSFLVGESISVRLGRAILLPLLVLGIGSASYWYWTEMSDSGDLRFYLLVQFLPMVLTPYILWFFPSALTEKSWLWWLTGFYVLAKLFEMTDHFWFDLTGVVSGHTLKHLAAAVAIYCMYLALCHRQVRPSEIRRKMTSTY